jgi:hypothetical protein
VSIAYVLHGRKSISWAKSVLPLFTGASSETLRKVLDPVQIDTTLNRQNCIQNHAVKGRRPSVNRTAVYFLLNKQTLEPYMTKIRGPTPQRVSLPRLPESARVRRLLKTTYSGTAVAPHPKPDSGMAGQDQAANHQSATPPWLAAVRDWRRIGAGPPIRPDAQPGLRARSRRLPKIGFAHDSALEGTGFELPVPREIRFGFRGLVAWPPLRRGGPRRAAACDRRP